MTFFTDQLYNPVSKFIVPDWGDKVDSGRGLLYRPDRLYNIHRLAGRYEQLYAEVNLFPPSGTMNSATVPFIIEIIGSSSQGQGVTAEVVPLINVNICNHNVNFVF
jgi:hypothetical protein